MPRKAATTKPGKAKAADDTAPDLNALKAALTQADPAQQAAQQAEQDRAADLAQQLQTLRAAQRLLAIKRARENLIPFIRLCMPDPEAPDDPEQSLYKVEPHHRILAEAVEKVNRRDIKRFALAIPPQHGKSWILSRFGVAWRIGKNPERNIIVGTYNSDFAREIGEHVREIVRSPTFKQVFPGVTLSPDSQAKNKMKVRFHDRPAGSLTFVGRGEATTGKPADDFIIDDPYKDKQEANSAAIKKQAKEWYSAVVFSRLHTMSTITLVHTRWDEDDLIGWLCDPEHPEHDPLKAKRWRYINVPAVVRDPALASALGMELKVQDDPAVVKAFGSAPMSALWPGRFPLEHLAEASENDKGIFTALYMGRPSPEEGDFFRREWFKPYRSYAELPRNMRYYAASDHAVSMEQDRDRTCLGVVGVDENDDIWILPDVDWRQMEADTQVESMIEMMRRYRPQIWWAEKGHISKSIGPFLNKRMREENVYCYVEEKTPAKDKKTRAQSIRGRAAQGKVHVPVFASWWADAENELLKFPNATHDDFVDWLAWVGIGLDDQMPARVKKADSGNVIRVGTLAWVKQAHRAEQRAAEIRKMTGGR